MKILVIDDDLDLNRGICSFLNSNSIETVAVNNGAEGLDKVKGDKFDIILSDLQMPKMDGLTLLTELSKRKCTTPVFIMTAFASIENAVAAMKTGAVDYIIKPINLKELLIKIEKICYAQNIIKENAKLKQKVMNYEMPEIIGESKAILELKEMLRRISHDSNVPVAIYGKSGTGKELVARNIHAMSNRSKNTFVPINCAVLSDELMESELFGHVRGAFTGADYNKVGLLENNDGGTIFLDEIGEMSPRVQAKLLRVLQDGMIQPIGSNNSKLVNIRFICASNKKLSDLVEQSKFREDLYFRLNVIEIEVPTLAGRKFDIPILIKHFFNKYDQPQRTLTADALELCKNYLWPGNIRELENLIRMLIVTIRKDEINYEDLPERMRKKKEEITKEKNYYDEDYRFAYNKSIFEFERGYLLYHLEKNFFNISRTAESINLSRVSLHKKVREYNLIPNKKIK